MKCFSIKNFERFQHYKDRRPPWVKLYRDLWHDPEFFSLTDSCKLLYIGLLTIASETENKIPLNPRWIQTRLAISEPIDITDLIDTGLIVMQHASKSLAKRYCRVRDRDRDRSTEKEETSDEVSFCAETNESVRSTPAAPPENSIPEKISDEPSEPEDQITCKFPCDGKKPFYQVSEKYIARMQTLYHGIDVREETLKALAWVENNPGRRKTHDGMTRFLGNWYSRAQNNGGARAGPQPRAPTTRRYSPLKKLYDEIAAAQAAEAAEAAAEAAGAT